MGIGVLGSLSIDSAETPRGRRDRVVLEVLAMFPGQPVSADRLGDAVWGDAPPPSAPKVLQGCIVRLRRLLGMEVIDTLPQGYRLALAADEIDAHRFERLIGRARELLSLSEPERSEYIVSEALSLWRGPAFAELEEWEPGRIEAGRLNELRLEAQELRVDACLRAGRFRKVLADAQAMVNEAPMRERRWALLALAQYQAGNQGEALRIIHHVRTLLARKLGLDPSPDIDALEQAILRQDPALAVAQVIDGSHGHCPYQGLRPYDVEDTESFFGRDSDVGSCLQRIRAGEPVAVVGASGSGKSSLVRAGVAATLRREGRRVVLISPGARPMDALAAVDAGRGAVLIVDQCEEVFSLCADHDERGRFLAALVDHAERASLVVALRADHLADVAAYPEFARIVERGLHLLTAMTADDLQLAIEQPARQAGLQIEPGLVDLLVREVENEPGALPLLSHALQETWQRREGTVLTVDGYRATGGIRGAVAQSAEDIYAHTASGERHLLRDLLLRLVSPGIEGEPVRSRMPRRLVVSDPAQDDLLDHLVAARLVTSDDAVVEIAHEALARAWPRLRAWLDDDVEGLRIRHHVTGAADAWERLGRPESELYRGVRLAQAREWRHRNNPVLTSVEAAFLTASELLAEAEERTAAMQARRQARMIRRLRTALGAGAVLLVVALVASGIAAREADRSNAALDQATQAEATADAHRLGAQALLTPDPTLADLLAEAGLQLDDDEVSRTNELEVLARQTNLIWTSPALGYPVSGLSVSADGSRVAAYDDDNGVSVLDRDGKLIKRLPIPADSATYPMGPVEFSPTQPMLAVGAQGYGRPVIELLDARTLEPLPRQLGFLPKAPSFAVDFDYSADGRYLAASLNYKTPDGHHWWSIRVWNLLRPAARPKVIAGHGGPLNHVALSADGRRVYASQPLAGYVVSTGRMLFRDPHINTFVTIDLDPVGDTLALGNTFVDEIHWRPRTYLQSNVIQLVDAATGEVMATLRAGEDVFVAASRFSHDGSLLVVGVGGGSPAVQVWDTATHDLVLSLPKVQLSDMVIAPDDSTLFTAGVDGTVRAWDLRGSRSLVSKLPVNGSESVLGQPVLSPDGKTLAIDGWEDRRLFVDLRTGLLSEARDDAAGWPLSNGEPDGAAWSPDSRVYAIGGIDNSRDEEPAGGLIETYDPTGQRLDSAHVPSPVAGLAYSADGRRLVVAELSGRVDVLHSATLDAVSPPVQLRDHACCVAAAPDGTHVFVLATAGNIAIGSSPRWDQWSAVDLTDGTVTASGSFGGVGALTVDYSPDSRRVAIGLADGTMRLIDVKTGEQLNSPVASAGNGVGYVTFDRTGDRVVTSGGDGAFTLWDGRSGEKEQSLPIGDRGSMVFAPTGDEVLIGDRKALVYRWHVGLDLDAAACLRAGRNLTRDEWATYLPGRPYEKTCPQFS